MPSPAGYSGKSLHQKLGLKPGMVCLTIAAPLHYAELVSGAEFVRFSTQARTADVIHIFCRTRAELDLHAVKLLERVGEGGMIWVSWPKKSSALHQDLTEDGVREVMLPTGWVDVKVCAIDADWSGLKFLKRRSK